MRLLPIDGGGQENQIGPKQALNKRQRNGRSFINNQELGLSEFWCVSRMNVLDGLTMVSENVDSHNCLVELWVGRLHKIVV